MPTNLEDIRKSIEDLGTELFDIKNSINDLSEIIKQGISNLGLTLIEIAGK